MNADILRVITRLNVGGPARHVLMMSRELQDRFPSVLAAGAPPPEEGELSDPDVPVQRVPLVRSLSLSADTKAFFAIRRLLRETNARVMDTHMAKAGAVGRLAALSTSPRPRTVHTFHGHVLDAYFGPIAQRSFIEIERGLARHTDVLVAVSDQVRDELLEHGIGRYEQFRVIPLGFDLSRFLEHADAGRFRRAIGVPTSVPLVAVVGRLVPIKDHETLFRAFQHLPDVHLAVVGDGQLRHALEASAREKGLERRIHFTGWWREIWQVYPEVDAVVLSSRNEGSPVALIEAHASGVPAVATDVGGTRSVVKDGETGYLVPPADPGALASALGRLLRDRYRAEEMGRAARAYVVPRFSHERLVADIRSLYQDLLN